MLPETQEDYWEDASVSIGSNHSWGLPFFCGSPLPSLAKEVDPSIEKVTNASFGWRRRRNYLQKDSSSLPYIVDFWRSSSARRSRVFPPPMSFSVTLSIKEGGRFVLKETEARLSPRSCFRAERENGRLRLCLLQSGDVDEGSDVYTDSDTLAAQPLDDEGQDVCKGSSDDDEHLVCVCSREFSDSLSTAEDDCIIDGSADTGHGNASAEDVPEICNGTLNTSHGDADADDVPKICDGISRARHDLLNADPETNGKNVCSIYAASLHDISGHCAGIGCSSSSNYEKMQHLNDRIVCDADVCMDSAGIPSSEMLPQMLDASPSLWTANDAASLIHLCHGSFAKLSPTVGLTVS